MPRFAEGDWVRITIDLTYSPVKAGAVGQVLIVFDNAVEPAYQVDVKTEFGEGDAGFQSIVTVLQEKDITEASISEVLAAGFVESVGSFLGETFLGKSEEDSTKSLTGIKDHSSQGLGPRRAKAEKDGDDFNPLALLVLLALLPGSIKDVAATVKLSLIVAAVVVAAVLLVIGVAALLGVPLR